MSGSLQRLTVVALGPLLSAASPCVVGQENTAAPETVLIVGNRASLASAQQIKRDRLELVDAVVADDIHKLPDLSVGEALQRVAGVQIARDRGEASGITVRGLSQIETLLNGREVFTAGTGRTLDFADWPAELVAALEVAKTSSAQQLDGGLGGTVNLRTRRPFDFAGDQTVLSVRALRSDLARRTQGQLTGLLSRRWSTEDHGEVGALLSLAYQERGWREDQKSSTNGTSETTSVGLRRRSAAHTLLEWRASPALTLYAEGSLAEFRTRQDAYQINVSPSASSTLTTDGSSRTWTNANVAILGFARDTVDRTQQLAAGGHWQDGDLTLKADLSSTRSFNSLFFSGTTLGGTAASFTQDLAGELPSTRVSGTQLLDPSALQYTGVLYRWRPFNGRLQAAQLDGELRVARGWLTALASGLRLAQRSANNAPGLVFGDAPVTGLGVADRPGYVVANPNGSLLTGQGATSLDHYLVGDPNAGRDPQGLRTALGVSSAIPAAASPLSVWHIREDSLAGYLMATFHAAPLARALDGNAGLRLVHTRTAVSGSQTVPSSAGLAPIDTHADHTDALPSANLRWRLDPRLQLRAAASKTITRPDFNQLSPSLSLLPNTVNPAQNSGSAGNPALHAIRSNNLDLAVERYSSRNTAAYAALFFKRVDGFITNYSAPEVHDGAIYQVSRPQNALPARIKGLELGGQQFLDFLPGAWRGLGWQAHYTFVDSEAPSAALGGAPLPLQNLSRHSANLVGLFETRAVSARLAYNWRGRFLSGLAGNQAIYTQAYGWLDASLIWRVNEQLSLAIEGANLTRTMRRATYSDGLPQSNWLNDRQLGASASLRF